MRFAPKGFKTFNDVSNLKNLLIEQRKQFQCEIDFYLLEVKTIYAKKGENKYKSIADVGIFNKNSNYISNITIRQLYKIEICKKEEKPARTFGFKLFPGENTTLRAILLCNNQMKFHKDIKSEIYQELYKTMILQGYLVGIREYGKLALQIDKFIQDLENKKIAPKTILNIGVGVASKEGKDGDIKIYHELKSENEINGEECSGEEFVPKLCINAVRKGDLLFEYIKPIMGNVGRDLKGEMIPIRQIVENAPKIDSTIRLREDTQIIKYQAGKDGFLKEKVPLGFGIVDELDMKQPKDGGAKTLNMGGSTHSSSKITTDIAYIDSHRGSIKANVAVIDVLEKGVVEAKVAYINNTLGGTIIADYIYIKEVRSYNEIYPRYSLVVDNIVGEHNTFELNPTKFAFSRRDRVEYVMLSDQIRIRLRHLRKLMDEVYSYLLASQGKTHKIKQDNKDEKLPKNLQSIVEQYDKSLERYQQYLEEYREIANLYYTNEVRLKNIDEAALKTKMIVRGEISEAETIVKFKVYNGNREELLKMVLSKEAPAKLMEVIKDGDFYRLKSEDSYEPNYLQWIEKLKPPKPD